VNSLSDGRRLNLLGKSAVESPKRKSRKRITQMEKVLQTLLSWLIPCAPVVSIVTLAWECPIEVNQLRVQQGGFAQH
jgi:hypothetical protein